MKVEDFINIERVIDLSFFNFENAITAAYYANENLEIQNPDLAEEIKKRMFVFEDLNTLDDRGMQRVLKEVDSKDLGLALKGASEDVKGKFLKNMSKRASQMLQDEMAFMGPVRIKDVEEAQQKIVNVVRGLEEAGELVLSRGGEDELIT